MATAEEWLRRIYNSLAGGALGGGTIDVSTLAKEATLQQTRDRIPVSGVPSDLGGTTSATAGQWTQLAGIPSTERYRIFIQNPPTNFASIEIGYGGIAGNPDFTAFILEPGQSFFESWPMSQTRINVRTLAVGPYASGLAVPYYAHEVRLDLG